jgi:hypothetical protein
MLAITNPNRSNPMASRTRKSPTLPVNTAAISYIRELPGAVFFGDAIEDDEAIEYAARLRQIRREYENDGYQEMLWHDLSQMGFDSTEIRQLVANPAAITNCGYGMPLPLR